MSGHIRTWLSGLCYIVFLVSTMAARRDFSPSPHFQLLFKSPHQRQLFSVAELLVTQLPNWFNENELGYLKHVKDFATQADFDWNWIRLYSHKQLHRSIWQDSNLVGGGQGDTGLVGSVGTAADGIDYVIQLDFDSWAAFTGQVVICSVAWISRHIIMILLFVGCELPCIWFGTAKAVTYLQKSEFILIGYLFLRWKSQTCICGFLQESTRSTQCSLPDVYTH